MEDVYLLHTYDSVTKDKSKDKSMNKIKKGESIQTHILQKSYDNNVVSQLYTKIINFVKKNN